MVIIVIFQHYIAKEIKIYSQNYDKIIDRIDHQFIPKNLRYIYNA